MAQYFKVNGQVHELDDGIDPAEYIKQPYTVITQGEVDAIHLADKVKTDAEMLGRENYKALIRREADALDAAGEPYKAIKHLKLIGE